MKNGYIQTSVAISLAGGILAVFGWTYTQFKDVNTNATAVSNSVAAVQQWQKDFEVRYEADQQDQKETLSELRSTSETILKAVK